MCEDQRVAPKAGRGIDHVLDPATVHTYGTGQWIRTARRANAPCHGAFGDVKPYFVGAFVRRGAQGQVSAGAYYLPTSRINGGCQLQAELLGYLEICVTSVWSQRYFWVIRHRSRAESASVWRS